ncbi:MAG: hypothetical protein QOC59_1243, partial [Microbacteriaceae bacterium]|nr:hypothetical protein [Microbacteriaceae bacterium]
MLDADIALWRARVTQGGAVAPADADELESHLRDEVSELAVAGLSEDEAFLVAVKRLGQVDRLTAEFAREHSERLWKQLALGRDDAPDERIASSVRRMAVVAVAGALVVEIARVASGRPPFAAPWFERELGLFLLVPLVAYFAWSRSVSRRTALLLTAAIAVLAVLVNVFPFPPDSATQVLVAVHLPVLLWFVVGLAYLGGEPGSSARRMDFLRFSGEWAVYYVLIALGGGLLIGLTDLVLAPIAPSAPAEVFLWVLPAGATGAVVVAAWLVEAKKSVIENIAPVLTAIFTPLFAVMLVVTAVLYAAVGIGRRFDRNLLTGFDVLLLVVLALVLYGLSARDPLRRAGLMDGLRFAAVVGALVLDLLVLGSMLARIGEFGFTANRVAALGLNLLLVVDLAG